MFILEQDVCDCDWTNSFKTSTVQQPTACPEQSGKILQQREQDKSSWQCHI
jgi:hypothetical protein